MLAATGCTSQDQGSKAAPAKANLPVSPKAAPADAPPARAAASTNQASMLSLQELGAQRNTSLRHHSQSPLQLALHLPEGDSWSSARLGRAGLRQPDGSQIQLASHALLEKLRDEKGDQALKLPNLMPGTSMIIVSAGTGHGERGRDDLALNHRFAKIMISQADASGKIPKVAAEVMQKTGQPLEIRPVRLPMALSTGDEMAIKVYEQQSHRGNVKVRVHHPNGDVQELTTKDNGMAFFDIRSPGMHHLIYESRVADQEASAELTFTVPNTAKGDN